LAKFRCAFGGHLMFVYILPWMEKKRDHTPTLLRSGTSLTPTYRGNCLVYWHKIPPISSHSCSWYLYMLRLMIRIFASCLMLGIAHYGWVTFPKWGARFGYYLVLGPLMHPPQGFTLHILIDSSSYRVPDCRLVFL